MATLLALAVIFAAGVVVGGTYGMKWGYEKALEQVDKIITRAINRSKQ